MPHRITGMNGRRGSHHYILNLIMDEAGLVATAHQPCFGGAVYDQFCECYRTHCDAGTCLCRTCAGFGLTYSVMSPCDVQELKKEKRRLKQAIKDTACIETVLSDDAATPLQPLNPT